MSFNDAAAMAAHETVWLDANRFYEAESRYYEVSLTEHRRRANPGHSPPSVKKAGMQQSSLASEIAYARQKIQNFLKSGDSGVDSGSCTMLNRLEKIEKEQEWMKQKLESLTSNLETVLSNLSLVEKFMKQPNNQVKETVQVVKKDESKENVQNGSSAATNDDDLDLFGSDEEDAEAAKLKEERLQAYANKKAKKPALVAKSSVVLDVKPWDDETDMKAMETAVRAVKSEGLVWGASKLVPLAYGIKKLQIVAIVEDDKVSIDWLQETISEIEELVQSVDIAAFNKL